MGSQPTGAHHSGPIVTALLLVVLATAVLASALSQRVAADSTPPTVNRTTRALAELQDMAPPGAELQP